MADQFVYNIPMSFRFDPTDDELIRAYLISKVMGLPLPWNGIVEKELYGDNASPWDVFSDIDSENSPSLYCNTKRESGKTKKTVYVFTKVTKAAPKSKKRIARRAGCGTWSGQTGSKDIIDSNTGDIIGYTKMFSFQYSKEDVGDFGHWIMHEYSLTDQWKTVHSLTDQWKTDDVVLCRITRCTNNSPRRPINIPATNKRPMEDDLQLQEGGGKKHKTAAEADWNLTADGVQRLIMDSDDRRPIPPPPMVVDQESCKQLTTLAEVDWNITADMVEEDWSLTADYLQRLIELGDDEKSTYEVEGCTVGEESVGALPLQSLPSSTTAGNGNVEWIQEENGVVSYCMDEIPASSKGLIVS